MDRVLKGHPYVKSALDMACWDILGQVAGLPVCTLLGGRYGEDFVLYRAISQESPDEMAAKVAGYRAEGYRRFQLKVGSDPESDIERIRAVRSVLEPGDVLVIDELGKMELASTRFVDAVHRLLVEDRPVFASVHAHRHPVTDRIKQDPGVEVVRVTMSNRDELVEQIADPLAGEVPED